MVVFREKEEGVVYEGNDRFEGYSIDLIDGIAKILGFKYVFEIVPDNMYGSYNKETKQWNGLVRHLLDRVREKTFHFNFNCLIWYDKYEKRNYLF